MSHNKRRKFLKSLGVGVLGIEVCKAFPLSNLIQSARSEVIEPVIKISKYNNLGKTGLKVSDIGFGAINYSNLNIFKYAFEKGIRYFDTAESYMQTMSETYLGQALKEIRKQVVISTKHAISSSREANRHSIIERVEGSLRRLQTDYLDIALIHNVSNTSILDNDEIQEAYGKLKKDGKVRFVGLSTHSAINIFPWLLSKDFFDVILFIYNHLEGHLIESLIKKVRKKGIGTIAMKALAGNKQGNLKGLVNENTKYSQVALRWVLSNSNIDSCLITMNTFSHIDEYVSASGKPYKRSMEPILADYRHQAGALYCRVSCSSCLPACPNRVAINDILRYAMYYNDYHMEKNALQLYAEMPQIKKPLPCYDCSAPCITACPFGLSVKSQLLHAHQILRV